MHALFDPILYVMDYMMDTLNLSHHRIIENQFRRQRCDTVYRTYLKYKLII